MNIAQTKETFYTHCTHIYIYDKTREYVTYIYILNVISFDASAWRKLTRSILVLYNMKPCEQ